MSDTLFQILDPTRVDFFIELLGKILTPEVTADEVRFHLVGGQLVISDNPPMGHALRCTFPKSFFSGVTEAEHWLKFGRDELRKTLSAVKKEKASASRITTSKDRNTLVITTDGNNRTSIRMNQLSNDEAQDTFEVPDMPDKAKEIDTDVLSKKCSAIGEIFSDDVILIGASGNEIRLSAGAENSITRSDYTVSCKRDASAVVMTKVLSRNIKFLTSFLSVPNLEECEFHFFSENWSNMTFKFRYGGQVELVLVIPVAS